MGVNSLGARGALRVGDETYEIYRLSAVEGLEKLPYSLRVLAECLLRTEDGANVTADHIRALAAWDPVADPRTEIQFTPARVIMQDFTGVPCIVDLATMREAMVSLGGDPARINPLAPAEMVIDHSVVIDVFGRSDALEENMKLEYQRNGERYQLLRWGQTAFDNFRVVPPGTGIVHQVNLEYLSTVVATREVGGNLQAFPDSCVGTDSHTTMVNGLGVLAWGVGGIEAEAAMLGQPVSMLIPKVVGFNLKGEIPSGATATDVVLTITELLRKHGVVGKIVEFYGAGVGAVPLANRATIGNMSPEYGATAAMFPIDDVTLDYLRLTGRSDEQVALVEAYAREQGMWHGEGPEAVYSEYLELDLSTVVPSIAGPKRPQDRIALTEAKTRFDKDISNYRIGDARSAVYKGRDGAKHELEDGAVVIASITSCTNTSNPSVMIAAGLLARNAHARGLTVKPWVKTSLAPGSKVVTDYYEKAGLWPDLDALGFNLVGYGCTTCIGNSGPLDTGVSGAIRENDLTVSAVLSGNRNFEGRINPDVKMNYLASPPLVIAYALAGTMDHDFEADALGTDKDGKPVYLRDIWPNPADVEAVVQSSITRDMFRRDYADVFSGDQHWQTLPTPKGGTFEWNPKSTYVRKPPYFDGMTMEPAPIRDIEGARVLAWLGDSVTTDHISPAGSIKADSPAGLYLSEHGVKHADFNSYGSRRGNHEVMIRGTFANIRLRNLLLAGDVEGAGLAGNGIEGGFTRSFVTGEVETIYDAAQAYAAAHIPLVILAGKEYGTGSSRDWAAKGTALLGVRAVVAESFERIHRSNLIGMGVLPLEFPEGKTAASLGLDGTSSLTIRGISAFSSGRHPRVLTVTATRPDRHGSSPVLVQFEARVRIDTPGEAEYFRHGGILPYVLRSLASS